MPKTEMKRTETEWREIIEQWRESKLSAPKFAQQIHCHCATLYYWRKKLSLCRQQPTPISQFLEVQATSKKTKQSTDDSLTAMTTTLQLSFGDVRLIFAELPPVSYLCSLLRGA